MMKCPNRGAEVREGDKICQSCQAPLEPETTVKENAEEASGVSGKADGKETEAEPDAGKPENAEEPPEETAEADMKKAESAEETAEPKGAEDAAEPKDAENAAESAYVGAGEPETAAPAKKGRKTALIAVAAAAVVGIGAFAMVNLNAKDPKDIVIDAFKSVYAEDQTDPIEEIFGWSQFIQNTAGSSESGITLMLDGSSDESVNRFAGSGFRLDQKNDNENLKTSVDLTAIYSNMDLLTMNLYYGDDKLMAAVPELFDAVLVADLGDGLAERIAASPTLGPVLEERGADVEGLVAYFKETMEKSVEKAKDGQASDPYDIQGLINRYKEGCKAQENFKAAMTVEKAGKADFTMDGKTVSCKGYQVHISKDSMIEFLRDSSDFFLQDEELKQAYLENLEASTRLMALLGTDYEGISAKELQEQVYENANEQVQRVITELDKSLQDVDMTVYVDSKGRLAAVDGSTAVVPEGQDPEKVTFEARLEGGAYLTQNARAAVTAGSEAEPVTVSLAKTGSWDGKQLTSGYEFRIQSVGDDMDVNAVLNGQYAVESGEYQLDAEARTNGTTQVKAALSGSVDELEKGSSIHINMDECSVEVVPAEVDFTLSGEYYLRPFSGEVSEPEGEQMDVFAAEESDWQNLMLQAFFRASGVMGKLDVLP